MNSLSYSFSQSAVICTRHYSNAKLKTNIKSFSLFFIGLYVKLNTLCMIECSQVRIINFYVPTFCHCCSANHLPLSYNTPSVFVNTKPILTEQRVTLLSNQQYHEELAENCASTGEEMTSIQISHQILSFYHS